MIAEPEDNKGGNDMKHYLERSMSFVEYTELIERLVNEGKTTGPTQIGALADFTRLNLQRMKRLSKTVEINNGSKIALKENARPMYWLVITEAWCGDAAQNIPVIEKIAAENDNIETRYILRDENPELMDRFLTDGTRSIPKLVALDRDSLEILGTWGPRPVKARQLFLDLKDKGLERPLINEQMQRWYNDDKGRSMVNEFVELLADWGGQRAVRARA